MTSAEHHTHFDSWVRDHGAILHHVVRGFAEGDDRQDLMQEVLLAVWKAVPAFRADSQVSTFLYRVTHNAAMTWQRGRGHYWRKLRRFHDLTPEQESREGAENQAARLEVLYAAIRSLPPSDRSLVLLSLDGVSYRAMAEIHGIKEGNVGARLTRLRQKLTKLIKEASS